MTASKLKLVTTRETVRTALYCRYSSDVQNDRSIECQIADLEKATPRLNLELDRQFYNRASEHPSVYVIEEKRLC